MDLRIIERLEKSFPRFSSLWIGIIAIILLLIPVDQLFGDLISSGLTKGTVYGLILFSYFIIWIYYRQKLPRKIGDKIGFVISIETENDEQKLRIKNDFSSHIKELLIENNITDAFDLLLLNDFQTERVNKILYNYSELLKRTKKNNYLITSLDRKIHRNWESAIRKTGGNFWVWGQIKERNELNSKYFFNLEAIVTHDPISRRENNPVQKAFDDAWIKKISVDERIELIGFEFTAELVYIGVNYVTGIAAFISRDPFTAFKLHENLLLELHKRFNPLPPKYKILDKNLHEFLSDECAAISHFYMLQENIPTAQEYLDKLFQYSEDNYEGHLLKAVFEFNSKNDALKALETIKKAAKLSKSNGAWRYSKAFLLLYLKKFEEALKTFFEIENYKYEDEEITLAQVINFNNARLIVSEKDLASNFMLGFVYLKKIENLPLSLEHLEKILTNCIESEENRPLLKKVSEYLKEIKSKMNIS